MKETTETKNLKEKITSSPADIRAVLDQFPLTYEGVTDEFMSRYASQIESLRGAFAEQGGIIRIDADEYSVLCRVPTKAMLDDVRNQSEKLGATDADMYLVSLCMLYPSGQEVRYWVDHGSPGIASVIARELLEEAKVTIKARRKKL